MEVLSPRESGKFIADNAKHVQIKEEGIKAMGNEVIRQINSGELSIHKFGQSQMHPNSTDPWAVDWLFVVDTLNFCFWTREHEEKWTVEGQTGYFAFCTAINRAIKEGIDITNPSYYSKITPEQASSILRSDTSVQVPLLEKRIETLHQVGKVLLEKFDGTFQNVIRLADKSAIKLMHLIVDNFVAFKDEADYKGKRVAIYKRVQILIGDIWACFKGQGVGEFHDIDQITMFADYRIPQTFLAFKVFVYSDELLERLKQKELLPNGDEMEVEIRGCSIRATELVTAFVNQSLPEDKKANDILVDHFLWDYRRKFAKEILEKGLPFHKTWSIYY